MNYDMKIIQQRKLLVFLINNVGVAYFKYRQISFTNLFSVSQIDTSVP